MPCPKYRYGKQCNRQYAVPLQTYLLPAGKAAYYYKIRCSIYGGHGGNRDEEPARSAYIIRKWQIKNILYVVREILQQLRADKTE